jgi:subtilisin family serine protease
MIEHEEEIFFSLKSTETKYLMLKRLDFVYLVLLAVGSAFGQPKTGDSVPGQLLVQSRLGANPSAIARTLAVNGARVQKEIPQIRVHVLRVPEPAIERVQQALSASGLFTFVERDHTARAVATPNDPNFVYEWHLNKIQAPNAWNITKGSPSITIALADSGVDPTHEDLASKLVPGWSFLTGASNTADVQGHGTETAGSAAAATNNGVGVAAAGWSNTIMPLQVVDSTGYASYSNMASAITYAADHAVRIINLSLAGSSASSTLQSAVSYAWNKGTVVFASAGNYSTSAPYYPAACTNAVAVSATDANDNLSSYSNYGNWIELSAPGDSILTSINGGGYGYLSGTSFSSPIAASVAALVLSVRPSLSASALVSLLEQNTDDLGAPGFDQYFGWGRVNAYKAVLAAANIAVDTMPPVVSISSPASSATLSGVISVQGTATDNIGVTNIEFYVDNQLVSSAASSPFSFAWSTAGVPNGSHTLTVRAYDASSNAGQVSVTGNVSNVTVVETTPPVVAITSPANGSTVTAKSVKINVSATDNVGVTQVCIYIDGILQSTMSAAPYTYAWNTRRATSGTHIITTTAWDAAGNAGHATPISVVK